MQATELFAAKISLLPELSTFVEQIEVHILNKIQETNDFNDLCQSAEILLTS